MSETDGERLARLETQMQHVFAAQDKHEEETKKKLVSMDEKLDSLLALRNKGAGAFLLASALFGTGIFTVASKVWEYLTHG